MTLAPVRTEGLTKTYPGGAMAVRPLDLRIEAGEVFGLLGPNGAGKTTTVGMLTTRVRPTAGRAWIGGAPLQEPVRVKRAIGVVSQTNTLDRALNVRDNLVAHGWYFGMTGSEAKATATRLLEAFHLTDWADRAVRDLSGGTAQRVMLARAVMHRPAVLFLDEPTTGLDPRGRLDAWEHLEELHRRGQTILLTTHFMEEAERLCDRVAVMDRGELIASGTPTELEAAHGGAAEIRVQVGGPVDAFTRALAARLGHAAAGPADVDPTTGTVTVAVRAVLGVAGHVLHAAEETGADILDLSVERPTLERVFLNLTGRRLRP